MAVHLYDMPCPHCGAPNVAMYRGHHVNGGTWRDGGTCRRCKLPVIHYRNDDDPYFRAAEQRRMDKLFTEKVGKASSEDEAARKAIEKAKAEGRYEEPLSIGGSVDSVEVTAEELAEQARRSALYGIDNPDALPKGVKLGENMLLSIGFGKMSDDGGFREIHEDSDDDE